MSTWRNLLERSSSTLFLLPAAVGMTKGSVAAVDSVASGVDFKDPAPQTSSQILSYPASLSHLKDNGSKTQLLSVIISYDLFLIKSCLVLSCAPSHSNAHSTVACC